ncbi:MAG: hypothetical protein IPP79_18155 [Chitinophagaceae bacterium]|nr:hypothetical protein [Chitinophagaceae bacterium]
METASNKYQTRNEESRFQSILAKGLKEFIYRPVLIEKGEDFERWQLPTHEDHLYAIEKYMWKGDVKINLNQQCQIGMLVEGESVEIITDKKSFTYAYAETFIIPAATENYTIRYSGKENGILLLSYVKDAFC